MLDQSFDRRCRKSLAVGYHGLSSRSRIHRQSASHGRRIHTGTPSAPARCTVELSIETTRSSAATRAAKPSRSTSGFPSLIVNGKARAVLQAVDLVSTIAVLQVDKVDAWDRQEIAPLVEGRRAHSPHS